MRILLTTSLILTGVLVMTQAASAAGAAKSKSEKVAKASILDHEMETLDGKKVNLAKKYKGKVVLLVNVASKCGNTPQYKPLEELHEKYGKEGLAIVGVPCNQFGEQEPGTCQRYRRVLREELRREVRHDGQSRCQRREGRSALQGADVEGNRPEVRRQDYLELREVSRSVATAK